MVRDKVRTNPIKSGLKFAVLQSGARFPVIRNPGGLALSWHSVTGGGAFNSRVQAAAILTWHGVALCMIAVNIADSGLAFACFGRLGADFVNGGRSCARGDFSWRVP